MSWYKKTDNTAGLQMNVTHIEDIKYKDLIRIFGKPNGEVKKFEGNDIMHRVEWKLKFEDTPFKVRIDSGDWARSNWTGKRYQVPDVREDFIDEIEIIGKLEFVDWVIQPIIRYLSNKKVLNEDLRFIIQYTFTGVVK